MVDEGGAAWALECGWGRANDIERIEECGRCEGADPAAVSNRARKRQRREMGTLGSGNHYLEVQEIAEFFDDAVARCRRDGRTREESGRLRPMICIVSIDRGQSARRSRDPQWLLRNGDS